MRNPWDRVVSEYFYGLKWHDRKGIALPPKLSSGFKNYVMSADDWPKKSLICQADFIAGSDFIGKFENLQEDFNTICDKVGITRKLLPHRNKSKRKYYHEYYDKEARGAVEERFKKDIEAFNYEY